MTEAEARALLLSAGYGDLEPWIAAQLWRAVPALEGWIFRVEFASTNRLRILTFPPSGTSVMWLVSADQSN